MQKCLRIVNNLLVSLSDRFYEHKNHGRLPLPVFLLLMNVVSKKMGEDKNRGQTPNRLYHPGQQKHTITASSRPPVSSLPSDYRTCQPSSSTAFEQGQQEYTFRCRNPLLVYVPWISKVSDQYRNAHQDRSKRLRECGRTL